MSASPSPPNPGAPRHNPTAPKQTNLARYGPRILLAGTALGVAYAFFVTRPPAVKGTPASSLLSTPGVRNVENAYANGGATKTHTKAYGGTQQGSRGDQPRDQSGTGRPEGFDSKGMGKEQRPQRPVDAQN